MGGGIATTTRSTVSAEGAGRPVVTCDPAMRFGSPTVQGISVGAVAEQVAAGTTVEDVARDFEMRREDVLVACWYVARHGEGDGMGLRTNLRRMWATWAEESHTNMAKGLWAAVADPPPL